MKSAYELALERLQGLGIEPPKQDLDDALRQEIHELGRQAEAKLAELEILHRDALKKLADPEARARAEDDYQRERRRIESDRDRKIEKLRATAG